MKVGRKKCVCFKFFLCIRFSFQLTKISTTRQVRQGWGNVRNAQNISNAECATPIWNIAGHNSNLAKILGQVMNIFLKFMIIFIKKLLKNPTLVSSSNV